MSPLLFPGKATVLGVNYIVYPPQIPYLEGRIDGRSEVSLGRNRRNGTPIGLPLDIIVTVRTEHGRKPEGNGG